MDLSQTGTYLLLEMQKNGFYFNDLSSVFKVTRMLKNTLSAPYFLNGCMDFNQTCTDV